MATRTLIKLLCAAALVFWAPPNLVRAQEPDPRQEAINLLRQAGQLVNQIPEQQRMSAAANIAGQLTVAGDSGGAVALARSLARPIDRGFAIGSIAYSLDYQGRLEEALQLLDEASPEQAASSYSALAKSHATKKDFEIALQLAHRIQDQPAQRVEALLAIAKSQWEAEKRDDALSTIREAVEAAEQAREKNPLLSIFQLGIARTQREMGMGSESQATLRDYSEFVHHNKDEGGMAALAITLAEMRDLRGALEVIQELRESSSRDAALGVTATNMAKKGNLEEALQTISRISSQQTRDMYLRSIAGQQGQDGRAQDALESVGLVPSVADRADALANLALIQAENGDPAARGTIELAWETVKEAKMPVPDYVFGCIVIAWVELGDTAEAENVLQGLSPEGRTWQLWNITMMLTEQGDKARAIALANKEVDPQPKAYALLGTATGILHRIKAEAEKGSNGR